MEPTDARWVLASRVNDSLQGGRAAVLPPESRARLQDLGRRLGLRPFDINLIIAIVQDHARCAEREPRSEMVARLSMIPGTRAAVEQLPAAPARVLWAAWIGATALLTAVLMFAAVAWLGV